MEDVVDIIQKDIEGQKFETPSLIDFSGNRVRARMIILKYYIKANFCLYFFQSSLYESGYGTLKRKPGPGKENSPSKKVKKALIQTWAHTEAPNHPVDPLQTGEPSLSMMPETPVSVKRCFVGWNFDVH